MNVFVQSYNLTPEVVNDLLSGKIPYRIEGDSVCFEYEGVVTVDVG